jgi:hypothetical protein
MKQGSSEIRKYVLLEKNLLKENGIITKHPFVKWHKFGAIYLANNHFNSQRFERKSRHCHFVWEWVLDDILKIDFNPIRDTSAVIIM